MTQTLFSPPAPQHAVPAPEPAPGRDRRRLLLAVLGVVVLAGIAAYFLLLKSPAAPAASPAVGRVPVNAPASAKASPAPALTTIPATYNQAVGRDPFAPLYTPPVVAPSTAPSTASSTTTSGSTTSGTTTASSSGVAPVSSTSSAPTTSSSAAAVTPAWIEMTSQNGTRYASFLVGYSNGTTAAFANVPAPAPYQESFFGQDFALDQIGLQQSYVQEGDGTPFDLKLGAANRHNFG